VATWPQFEEPPKKIDSGDSGKSTEQPKPLTEDELMLLRQFFELLEEWDRKSKVA
jgi:hypothetical protein